MKQKKRKRHLHLQSGPQRHTAIAAAVAAAHAPDPGVNKVKRELTLVELMAELRGYVAQIERIKQKIIEVSPVQVGQHVEINMGGSLGKQMVVNTVQVVDVPEYNGWYFTAQGAALRADGTPGSMRGIHTFRLPD